jgi:hypothetical protein
MAPSSSSVLFKILLQLVRLFFGLDMGMWVLWGKRGVDGDMGMLALRGFSWCRLEDVGFVDGKRGYGMENKYGSA